jgi:hypothetical protein
MPWEISDEEMRGSFEVVRLEDLPPDGIEVVPSVDQACGCHWCEADWPAIANTAVAILEAGIDPLNDAAIHSHSEALGWRENGWLQSLFNPTQAIIVLRDSQQFTNGRHRTHALRVAGVERCVVYTGRGEMPYDT